MEREGLDDLIAEQSAYYRAVASQYEAGALEVPGGDELEAALDAFRPTGRILELACGPGTWTPRLLRDAESLTAVDGSAEMLDIARSRIGDDPRVRFVRADIFDWRPAERYDVVFFGFWISHVPLERFAEFWGLVADCLEPDGRVFFADDAYRTDEEQIEGAESDVIRRRVPGGQAFRAIKVPHTAESLQARLRDLGWEISVSATAGPFYWGAGRRRPPSAPAQTSPQ